MSSYRHRNALYLRLSPHVVLPLYLYLDDKHTAWMSDKILQQVIADLKPFILAKWREEEPYKSVTSGPQAKKFGKVDVYRGDAYQVAYFLQKNETHSILLKRRNFTLAPPEPVERPQKDETPVATSSKLTRAKKGKKGSQAKSKATQPKKKQARKRKRRIASDDEDEEMEDENMEDEETNDEDNGPAQSCARRSTRTRTAVAGAYREEDDEDGEEGFRLDYDAENDRTDQDGANKGEGYDASKTIHVKTEVDDEPASSLLTQTTRMDDASSEDEDIEMNLAEEVRPSIAPAPADVGAMPPPSTIPIRHQQGTTFEEDDEEEKPKPILGLRYTGFTLPDASLAIIVEPWSSAFSRASTRDPSIVPMDTRGNASRFVGVRGPSRQPTPALSEAGDSSRTPLFREFTPMEDGGRSGSIGFGAQGERVLPRVPLFHEETPAPEDGRETYSTDYGYGDDDDIETEGLMQFSQAMNMTGAARIGVDDEGDDDDNDAFVGDADERR